MPLKVNQRAAYKGQWTSLKRELDQISRSPDKLDRPETLEFLYSSRLNLETIEKNYSKVQLDIIEDTQDPKKKEEEEQDMKQFLDEVLAMSTKINQFIGKIEAKKLSTTDQASGGSGDLAAVLQIMTMQLNEQKLQREQDQANFKMLLEEQRKDFSDLLMASGSQRKIDPDKSTLSDTIYGGSSSKRLDTIKIRPFSGNYSEWKTFKDLFMSIIDKDESLSDAEKMQYLKGYIVGEAEPIIETLNVSGSNYKVAWDLLNKEFDKKALIIASYVKEFYALPGSSKATVQGIQSIQRKANSLIQAMDAMNVTSRDPFLIYSVLHKLDEETQARWARKTIHNQPTWEEFNDFLAERGYELKMCQTDTLKQSETSKNTKTPASKSSQSAKKTKSKVTSLATTEAQNCGFCQQHPHKLYRCRKFLSLDGAGRLAAVKEMKICENCLSDNHKTEHCSYILCKFCNGKHNRLLHDVLVNLSPLDVTGNPSSSGNRGGFSGFRIGASNSATLVCEDNSSAGARVLLATIMVRILDAHGVEHYCRAILDAGSQVNIISSRLCQQLSLKMRSANFLVETVGSSLQSSQHQADVVIHPWIKSSPYALPINCLVMRTITGDQPNWDVSGIHIDIPRHFHLADPDWQSKKPVDILIGGQFYWEILRDETHYLGPGFPLMKNTTFGWVVVGSCDINTANSNLVTCNLTTLESIEQTLRKFFTIEDVPKQSPSKEEHKQVEELYSSTTTRDADGRYIVQLPFNSNLENLQSNRSSAMRQLHFLESKLKKNVDLWEQYSNIFEEYLEKDFIEVVPYNELEKQSFYMPHHCVVKKEAVSTKVRIVFNASSPSSSGVSLNDTLMVGPCVQPTLMSTLLNFRLHAVTFTCDIVKMYLQTRVHEQHRDFLRFLWRTPDNKVRDFRFKVVCFGVSSSPYLATRSLNQLAMDEGHEYPLAAELVKKHFYVDDCLFSAPTFEEAREAKEQLISLLNLAQLELSKFRSNHPDLQSEPTDESQQIQEFEELVVKTLGMTLNVNTDTFQYKVAEIPEGHGTLRVVMSTVARIYDPLGLITPITVVAKAILQSVWKFWKDTEDSVNFDKPIPPEIEKKWIEFKENLQHLEELRIPRWISSIAEVVRRVLHCFCDASKLAHASCIYLVSEDATGNRCSRLLTSKSKVNPMKFRDQSELTIPKAELCAAELAANLAEVVSSAMGISECHLWTDATVVLYQIYNSSRKRESFVKRRTEKILKLTTAQQWNHVDTKENPADLASRGTSPQQLESSTLWWNGPTWLLFSQKDWPKKFSALEEPTECSLTVTTGDTQPEDNEDVQNPTYQALLSRYSTYSKLRRVTARCLEASFIWKSALRRATRNTPRPTFSRHLSVQYLRDSETFLIKSDQRQHLGQVIRSVENGALNSKRIPNQIQKLRPFLDADGVLRVGGRLTNSLEPFDARHPRILPKSHLAKLIAEREHVLMLHSGPQLTLSSLRQKYWPIEGRNLTKKIARNCHPCIRAKPPTLEQLMGNLPRERVVNFRPFTAVGVDFAGPFLIKHGIRKYVKVKAYVAVFVCFGTKAVHLELVSSLHTAEFIAAFRRFVARRGLPTKVFSDNGKTFVGADRQIRELWETENHKSAVHRFTSELGIEWSFLTPRAPHQGGIYEAAVKSFKHHFVRVIGRNTLTFESFTTLLCQIEAVLNSRPLITLSENPEDPVSLTPSSYLIHSSLTQLPDPDLTHLTWNHLSKWQMVQRISQDFTKRWKQEYLNTLQSRQKWSKDHENLKEGDMVMISDEILPLTKWPIGIVAKTYPGQDDRVRVVDVRTRQGTYRRAIQKLIKFPVED